MTTYYFTVSWGAWYIGKLNGIWQWLHYKTYAPLVAPRGCSVHYTPQYKTDRGNKHTDDFVF